MKAVSEFKTRTIRVVLTDIDGTLTQEGRLPANSYTSLWQLANAGLSVIPVTGRPAGWCELIARLWPVDGVVGENGALYFRLAAGKMARHFARNKDQRRQDRRALKQIRDEILREVPGAAVASDQFARLFDLAIDFAEDVPHLADSQVQRIAEIFRAQGATAKISNIHVNGWFGTYDKVSTCRQYLKTVFGFSEAQMKSDCIFVGDSPNDEPMFEFFPHSFAVANIEKYLPTLKFKPNFMAKSEEGDGFCEIATRLLVLKA